jgi:1-acyl-sn-glycerol-3-phosphate acyltransferase
VLDVHTEARPRLPLVALGDLGGAVREVADVADGGLDDELRPEVAGDRAGLRGRLDDDETLRHRRVTIATAAARDTPGVRPPLLYHVVAVLSWPVLYGPFRLRARGRENLPVTGGYVLACNHVSSLDPWPLGLPLWPSRWLRFMAKSELYWWPLRLLLDGAGAFKVRRGLSDAEAIETAVRLAREGHAIAMFPEGTRRVKGIVKKHEARPRSGAARIALEAGVPLVPAAVAGTDRLLSLGPLRIAYGPPVDLDGLRGAGDPRDAAQEATDRLMARIAELEASL